MRNTVTIIAVLCALTPAARLQAQTKCPPDSVPVGPLCVDKYEASVWRINTANKALVKKVQQGKATLADLQKFTPATGVGVQLGCTDPPFNALDYNSIPNSFGSFPPDGNWIPLQGSNPPNPGVFAVSIPGVLPSTCITWFQANQACALVGKRLLRNDEWQRAAAGTPDPGTDDGATDCNIGTTNGPVTTGSRTNCHSSWGVFDMIGNAEEWVADWADRASGCTDWTTSAGFPGGDESCFGGSGGPGSEALPGVPLRGGSWSFGGTQAGLFTVNTNNTPDGRADSLGFRCAR